MPFKHFSSFRIYSTTLFAKLSSFGIFRFIYFVQLNLIILTIGARIVNNEICSNILNFCDVLKIDDLYKIFKKNFKNL